MTPRSQSPSRERQHLLRALDAEAELESARERIAALEDHLLTFVRVGNDPALLRMLTICESLLAEALQATRADREWELSWMARTGAQLRIAEIFRRDGL